MDIRIFIFKAFVFCYLCIATNVMAAALQVNPTQFNFNTGHPIQTLEITNHDASKVVVQLDIKKWRQDNQGKDVYEETPDILVTPAICTLEALQSQLIRIALLDIKKTPIESAYRLIIREVVNYPAQNENNLQMALQILLPIFIQPENKSQMLYTWKLESVDQNKAALKITNTGNEHILVTKIALKDAKKMNVNQQKTLFAYLLPGTTKVFNVGLIEKINKNEKFYLDINNS